MTEMIYEKFFNRTEAYDARLLLAETAPAAPSATLTPSSPATCGPRPLLPAFDSWRTRGKDDSRAGSKQVGDFTKAFVDAVYAKLLVVESLDAQGNVVRRKRRRMAIAAMGACRRAWFVMQRAEEAPDETGKELFPEMMPRPGFATSSASRRFATAGLRKQRTPISPMPSCAQQDATGRRGSCRRTRSAPGSSLFPAPKNAVPSEQNQPFCRNDGP